MNINIYVFMVFSAIGIFSIGIAYIYCDKLSRSQLIFLLYGGIIAMLAIITIYILCLFGFTR